MKSPITILIIIVFSLCCKSSNGTFLRQRELSTSCEQSNYSLYDLECPSSLEGETFTNGAASSAMPQCLERQSDNEFLRYPAFYDDGKRYGGDHSLEVIDGDENCSTAIRFTFYATYGNLTEASIDYFHQSTQGANANSPVKVEYNFETSVCECIDGCGDHVEYTCEERYNNGTDTGIDVITITIPVCDILKGDMQCCGELSADTFYFKGHFVAYGETEHHHNMHGDGEGPYALTPFHLGCSAILSSPSGKSDGAIPSSPSGQFDGLIPSLPSGQIDENKPLIDDAIPLLTSGKSGDINDSCLTSKDINVGDKFSDSTVNGAIYNGTIEKPFVKCGTATYSKAPGLWYRIPAPSENTILQIRLCGSKYDTQVSIFAGTDCQHLRCVSGNDDSKDCARTSVSTWNSRKRDSNYYIYVYGHDDIAGEFDFELIEKDSWF